MVKVSEIERKIFDWAPRQTAMEWDNVGLLVGDGLQEIDTVLIALDITQAVAEEAVARGASLIISHHPLMNCVWHKVQTIRADDRQGKLLRTLIKHDISAVCMHTNLDIAEGGVNDCLARRLGLQDVVPFNEEKIGRLGTLSSEIPLEQFLPFVVKSLGCNGLRFIDGRKSVHKIAVGGGACRDYIEQVQSQGCDTYVTSDLRYQDFLDTEGLNLIDAGHFPTEQVVCTAISEYLQKQFPSLHILHSTAHAQDVIQYYI